jgi:hypothetical protein
MAIKRIKFHPISYKNNSYPDLKLASGIWQIAASMPTFQRIIIFVIAAQDFFQGSSDMGKLKKLL